MCEFQSTHTLTPKYIFHIFSTFHFSDYSLAYNGCILCVFFFIFIYLFFLFYFISDFIDLIKARAHIISSEFAKLFRKIEKERWKHVKSGSLKITCQIRSLLHECNTALSTPNNQYSEVRYISAMSF